nr:transcription termination factor Rho [Pseudonocardia abyssalis]
MVLAELRQLAEELNISGTTGMRKGDLIAAIKERQAGAPAAPAPAAAAAPAPAVEVPVAAAPAPAAADNGAAPAPTTRRRRTASRPAGAPDSTWAPAATTPPPAAEPPAPEVPAPAAAPVEVPAAVTPAVTPAVETPVVETPAVEAPAAAVETAVQAPSVNGSAPSADTDAPTEGGGRRGRSRRNRNAEQAEPVAADAGDATEERGGRNRTRGSQNGAAQNNATQNGGRNGNQDGAGQNGTAGEQRSEGRVGDARDDNRGGGDRGENRNDNRGGNDRSDNRADRNDNRGGNDNRGPRDNRPDDDSDDDGDGRGRRGRRFRDRRRGRDRDRGGAGNGGGQGNVDTEVRDDDVLLPVAGIVDILDNYAFVRTTGYLSGPTDCYVSLSLVRKHGLRRGDAITGAVREGREGEQSRQKFNPLVRVDTINGQDPEASRNRAEFTKLTPLYPNDRLRLETESHIMTTRIIDLVMPIGKGQRALIVSPPKAGKTMVLQAIANAITTNNPECHLMVVLVDERPEEVTDMTRSVKGEVIASTFDRPASDHTTVAELAIERAKRLVEMGHDVVVLLDSITRLGRAYNLAAPASGRILSGGVDSTALYPPKRFLGAARNIENGGSLTILATALVETGSTMDTVIFEEFKGTGNAELKLDRRIADKRVFPAVDVGDSGTRKEELLLSPDELAVMVKLRRVLSALDDQQAIDLLLTQLKKTRTNIEFLMQVAKGLPVGDTD